MKEIVATSIYSYLLNLYFNVVKNFGFTSVIKLLTSSTHTFKSSLSIFVADSSSYDQTSYLVKCLVARIKHAAAISDPRYFKSEASRSAISCKYCAKKKV